MLLRVFFAVCVLLLTITEALSQPPAPSVETSVKPEQAQSNTPEQRGTEQAPFIIKILPAPKAAQETHQAAKDRKQKAREERLLLIFNGLLAFFTFLLFLSTLALWRTNKETTKSTKTLATIEKTIQRAYVSAEPEGLHPLWGDTREQHFVIGHVRFRNGGHIPARDFRWYAKIEHDANDRRETFPIPDVADFDGTAIIAPGSAMMFGTKEIELSEPTGWIYVWGAYTYDDGFVPNRYATFCHRYNRSALRKNASPDDRPSGYGISAEDGRIHRFGNTERA